MEEFESKIISNNKKISDLLEENERLLREAGYFPPGSDWKIPKEGKKIHFPKGYVRPNDYFIKKYKLNTIVCNQAERKNIAYSFQLADYYGYFISRFHIWGSISIMFYKHDIINLVAIIEALATSATTSIANNRKRLFRNGRFSNLYPDKSAQNYLKPALEWAKSSNITHLTGQQICNLYNLYKLRNHVHISNDESYDTGTNVFNQANHDMAEELVEQVADDINAHWVQYYYLPLPGCRQ